MLSLLVRSLERPSERFLGGPADECRLPEFRSTLWIQRRNLRVPRNPKNLQVRNTSERVKGRRVLERQRDCRRALRTRDLRLGHRPTHVTPDSSLKLLSGHWPVKPDQALIGFSMQQQYGLHVGSVIEVPSTVRLNVTRSQRDDAAERSRSHDHLPRRRSRSQPGGLSERLSYLLDLHGRGVRSEHGSSILGVDYAQVRLVRGELDMPQFQPLVNNYGGGAKLFVQDEESVRPSKRRFIPSSGLALFGVRGAGRYGSDRTGTFRQSLVETRVHRAVRSACGRNNSSTGHVAFGVIGVVGAIAVRTGIRVLSVDAVGEAGVARQQGFYFDATVYWWDRSDRHRLLCSRSCVVARAQVRGVRTRDERTRPRIRASPRHWEAGRAAEPSSSASHASTRSRRTTVRCDGVDRHGSRVAARGHQRFGSSLSNLAHARLYGSNWQVIYKTSRR